MEEMFSSAVGGNAFGAHIAGPPRRRRSGRYAIEGADDAVEPGVADFPPGTFPAR